MTLHETVEDQVGTDRLGDIRVKFGCRVWAIVHACSDSVDQPKTPWRYA